MRSTLSEKDLKDNCFRWLCVKLEALKNVLSFLTITLYQNAMFLRLFLFNSLFLFRLVETELDGSVPYVAKKLRVYPLFENGNKSIKINKERSNL